MTGPIDPFDLAYTDLLTELAELSLPERAQALELAIVADSIVIPFFGSDHLISPQGVIDHNG